MEKNNPVEVKYEKVLERLDQLIKQLRQEIVLNGQERYKVRSLEYRALEEKKRYKVIIAKCQEHLEAMQNGKLKKGISKKAILWVLCILSTFVGVALMPKFLVIGILLSLPSVCITAIHTSLIYRKTRNSTNALVTVKDFKREYGSVDELREYIEQHEALSDMFDKVSDYCEGIIANLDREKDEMIKQLAEYKSYKEMITTDFHQAIVQGAIEFLESKDEKALIANLNGDFDQYYDDEIRGNSVIRKREKGGSYNERK